MLHVVLYEPEIPPNTGNIIRLCANAGAQLHLIQPLGFTLSEKAVQRAGMDYIEIAMLKMWNSFDECLSQTLPRRWYAMSTRAERRYTDARFAAGDMLVFGPETRGLPADVLASCPAEHRLRIPMQENSRSINLSNAAAIVLYEAWRQLEFAGGR